MTTRPLLFLDVDGTLIPFGGDGYPTGNASNPLLGLPSLPVMTWPDDDLDTVARWLDSLVHPDR